MWSGSSQILDNTASHWHRSSIPSGTHGLIPDHLSRGDQLVDRVPTLPVFTSSFLASYPSVVTLDIFRSPNMCHYLSYFLPLSYFLFLFFPVLMVFVSVNLT